MQHRPLRSHTTTELWSPPRLAALPRTSAEWTSLLLRFGAAAVAKRTAEIAALAAAADAIGKV